jgi:hypothetical protein
MGRFVGREFKASGVDPLSLPFKFLDKCPIVIVLAGSNGAGKLTFYESSLADSRLRFVNAAGLVFPLPEDLQSAALVSPIHCRTP